MARRALLAYGLAGVVILLVVGVGAVGVSMWVAAGAAEHEAADSTASFARRVVTQRVTPALRQGAPAALAALDAAVRARMADGSILRVKVWAADGTVLYSDESSLIGRTFELEPEEVELLRYGGVQAAISPVSRAENEFERPFVETMEVYVGLLDASGEPVLVEAYLPTSNLRNLQDDLIRQITPVVVGSLLVLELLLLPLGVGLTLRLQRYQRDRDALARLAAAASAAERRAVAAQLHDGVIQDLAGVGYVLTATAGKLSRLGRPDLADTVRSAAGIVRDDVSRLRGMIRTLHETELGETGLPAAVEEAVADVCAAGIVVDARVEDVPGASREARAALFLVTREALRNVLAHAHAGRVTVRLGVEGGDAVLEVSDDGRGFDPENQPGADQGHLGLTLFRDAAEGVGGYARLDSAPGAGTRLEMRVPLAAAPGSRHRSLPRLLRSAVAGRRRP